MMHEITLSERRDYPVSQLVNELIELPGVATIRTEQGGRILITGKVPQQSLENYGVVEIRSV